MRKFTKKPAPIKPLPKLHLACSTDQLRERLEYVYIDGHFAVATNAHVLVSFDLRVLNFSEEMLASLNGCMIHRNLWKILSEKDVMILSVENGKMKYGRSGLVFEVALRTDLTFLDYKAVLFTEKDITPVPSIGFNIYFLEIIRKSTGMNTVKFEFHGQIKGITVTPIHVDDLGDTFALLMPIMINEY
jgi:hypothetical protein